AAETLRQQDASGGRPPLRIPFKLAAAVIAVAAMLGGGFYAYQTGRLDDLIARMTAPAPAPEPAPVPAPPPAAAAAQPAAAPKPTWSVKVELVNLRGAASIDGPIVGTAKRNTVVTEIDHDGNWIKIQAPGANGVVEGWVNQRMLEEIKPQP